MRVAELDRLFDEHVLVRVVAGKVEQGDDAASEPGDGDNGQDAQSGVDVGGAMKDLTHRVEVRTDVFPRAYSKPGRLQKWQTFFCRHAAARSAPAPPSL